MNSAMSLMGIVFGEFLPAEFTFCALLKICS